jgi:hypothetical protein
MVWKAIGLCTIGELDKLKAYADLVFERQQNSMLEAERNLEEAKKWRGAYEALVEKLSAKAAKPDDGIIHAKNSGDVRRIFEQQISAAEAKRDKELEN